MRWVSESREDTRETISGSFGRVEGSLLWGEKKQNLEDRIRINNFKTVGDIPGKNKTYVVYEVPNTKTKNTRLKI